MSTVHLLLPCDEDAPLAEVQSDAYLSVDVVDLAEQGLPCVCGCIADEHPLNDLEHETCCGVCDRYRPNLKRVCLCCGGAGRHEESDCDPCDNKGWD